MYVYIKIYDNLVDANHLAEVMLIKHLHNKVTGFSFTNSLLEQSQGQKKGVGSGYDCTKVSKSKFTNTEMCRQYTKYCTSRVVFEYARYEDSIVQSR